jgi:hypothetical protein
MCKARLPTLSLAILLGLTSFGAPAAQAASKPPGRSWGILVKGLAAAFGWLDIGCTIRPGGACQPGSLPAERGDLDCGLSMDPSGACRPSSLPAKRGDLDCGFSMDPNDACLPGSAS